MAYDLLEKDGTDIRQSPFAQRRGHLAKLLADVPDSVPIRLSPQVTFSTWDDLAAERERSRDLNAEGIMLKKLDSPYLSGRKRGDWYK